MHRAQMSSLLLSAALGTFLLSGGAARAEGLTPNQQMAHDIYKELVEIETTTASGDTRQVAEAMASRLKAAGFADEDIHVLSPAPHKGNLVARLRGTGKRKPILLIASEPSKLNEEMVGAIEKLSNEFWPGAAVIPVMSTGATDGVFLRNAGIPTYGHSGMAMEPATPAHSHRDERAPMKSFYNRNEYLYRLVKMLAGGS